METLVKFTLNWKLPKYYYEKTIFLRKISFNTKFTLPQCDQYFWVDFLLCSVDIFKHDKVYIALHRDLESKFNLIDSLNYVNLT